MAKVNYHTHTYRCKHALGTDEEYVLKAIEGGIEELGFSDHCPWPYRSDYVSGMRMSMAQLEDYVSSIRKLKEKYKDRLNILIGLECEYFPEYLSDLKAYIKEYDLDYIILGNHFYRTDENRQYYGRICDDDLFLKRYVDDAISALDSGLYSYFCHPDLFMRGRKVFDDKAKEATCRICEYAKRNDVALEYNLEGQRNTDRGIPAFYPCIEFWKIAASFDNKVIIGFDAHDPKSLADLKYYDQAMATLEGLGLKITDELDRRF